LKRRLARHNFGESLATKPFRPYNLRYCSALEWNKVFELRAKGNNYHVRYLYTKLEDGATEMEYFEWFDLGEPEDSFPQDVLEKLKSVIESSENAEEILFNRLCYNFIGCRDSLKLYLFLL